MLSIFFGIIFGYRRGHHKFSLLSPVISNRKWVPSYQHMQVNCYAMFDAAVVVMVTVMLCLMLLLCDG
jgi:hypothetical protein